MIPTNPSYVYRVSDLLDLMLSLHVKCCLFIFQCLHISGQRLCLLDNEHVSGNGTYEHQGYIHSSLAGIVKISEKTENNVKVRS